MAVEYLPLFWDEPQACFTPVPKHWPFPHLFPPFAWATNLRMPNLNFSIKFSKILIRELIDSGCAGASSCSANLILALLETFFLRYSGAACGLSFEAAVRASQKSVAAKSCPLKHRESSLRKAFSHLPSFSLYLCQEILGLGCILTLKSLTVKFENSHWDCRSTCLAFLDLRAIPPEIFFISFDLSETEGAGADTTFWVFLVIEYN